MIKLDGLHKFFNKGKSNEIHVINDVSLDFPDHGMVAIFGRSGCGKTTLLNVIGGLDKVQKGSVFVEGQAMSASRDELRNKYIGYIFQNYCLNVNDSCFDNVATALRLCGMTDEEEIARRVHIALTAVGMDTFYKRTPNTLSGGQQQRIAIARAIVKDAPIILADEPTGNLDEQNTIVIMDILKQISKTHLVLLVTHEEKLVDYYCDSVIELSDGKVVNIRNNGENNGYIARDKNTIYLGEYEKTVAKNEAVNMEYYGSLPDQPVKVRMVNRNGVLYLKIDSPGVHVLDETSEVHLEEGVFEEAKREEIMEKSIDLSGLEPFETKNLGKLFGLKDGIKSGLKMVFATNEKKKGAKRLRKVMTVFALVLVMVVARFGVGIKDYNEAKIEHNSKLVHVYCQDAASAAKLVNKVVSNPDYKIEQYYFEGMTFNEGNADFYYTIGSFETYSKGVLDLFTTSGDSIECPVRPLSDAKGYGTVAGTQKLEGNQEIVISRSVADRMLKHPTFNFVRSYDDLIGSYCESMVGLLKLYYTGRLEQYNKRMEDYERQKNQADSDEDDETDDSDDEADDSDDEADDPDDEYYDGGYSTDVYGNRYYGESKERESDKYRLMQIVGIADTQELVIYINDDLFTDSMYMKEQPKEGDLEHYYDSVAFFSNNPERLYHDLENMSEANYVSSGFMLMKSDMEDARANMASMLSVLAVLIGILAVCIYFIMRSMNMNRMKEVGIYRAIGVSRKNLFFRFAVETTVITTLSATIGYILASALLIYMKRMSSKIDEILFYSWWIALGVLVLIYVICIFAGTLSVRSFLRKTPAEIMAKYDI